MAEAHQTVCVADELIPSIHINTAEIPAFQREDLARGAIELTKQVFSLPGEEKRYREWLNRRKAAAAVI